MSEMNKCLKPSTEISQCFKGDRGGQGEHRQALLIVRFLFVWFQLLLFWKAGCNVFLCNLKPCSKDSATGSH